MPVTIKKGSVLLYITILLVKIPKLDNLTGDQKGFPFPSGLYGLNSILLQSQEALNRSAIARKTDLLAKTGIS
jgi:hypothetical protein